MCGIFGTFIKKESTYSTKTITSITDFLSKISYSRGKDSSGFCFKSDFNGDFTIVKSNISIKQLSTSKQFEQVFSSHLDQYRRGSNFSYIGHSRLVTNGSHLDNDNNQPVLKDELICVHNGIVVNHDSIWEKIIEKKKSLEIDTEAINSLIKFYLDRGNNLVDSTSLCMRDLEGTASIALLSLKYNKLLLSTNNGSLYVMTNGSDFLQFASERFFLEENIRVNNINKKFGKLEIFQISPGHVFDIDISSFETNEFKFSKLGSQSKDILFEKKYNVNIVDIENFNTELSLIYDVSNFNVSSEEERNILENNAERISKIQRCKKCILPTTFPFLKLYDDGICNYCKNYRKRDSNKNIIKLKQEIETYKNRDNDYDCIVPLSGGRDSTFVLHFVKNELNLNPLTYTYDWSMVTDLARRNISRICSRLEVENIIRAADISKKRNYIKKNVAAWLKNPELGMIPIFMAGDKYFFYYTQQLMKQTNIKLNIWGINRFEDTYFKSGFAGAKPNFSKDTIFSLSNSNVLALSNFFLKSIFKNPSYLNTSFFNNLGGHISRLMHPNEGFVSLFDYYDWNETEIMNLIESEYSWESASDTKSSWRIGDGTASFYNYIYYNTAGFSEIDTFRSNQVREKIITRDQALQFSKQENIPRYENIKWYLKMIDIPFKPAIRAINKINKLYD